MNERFSYGRWFVGLWVAPLCTLLPGGIGSDFGPAAFAFKAGPRIDLGGPQAVTCRRTAVKREMIHKPVWAGGLGATPQRIAPL